jgi:hypothetical protein
MQVGSLQRGAVLLRAVCEGSVTRPHAAAVVDITRRITGDPCQLVNFGNGNWSCYRWQGRTWVRLDPFCEEHDVGVESMDPKREYVRKKPVQKTILESNFVERMLALAQKSRPGNLA